MKRITIVGLMLLLAGLLQVASAQEKQLQQYLSDVVTQVKQTADPVEKRALLDGALQKVDNALTVASQSPLTSKEERGGLLSIKRSIQDKLDELHGRNSFTRVEDRDLNAFAEYSVQDLEQADQWITISVTTLLLIVIIILLLR